MWKQEGKTHLNGSSALERAKVQLSGQRITNTTTRRDALQASLESNLMSRQTAGLQDLDELFSDTESEKHHHVRFLDMARHSAESPEPFCSGGGSRFLKRPAGPISTSAQTPEVRSVSDRGSQSVTLSRLALIEERIRNRNQKFEPETVVRSSSELGGTQVSNQKSDRRPAGPRGSGRAGPGPCGSYIKQHVSLDSDEDDMRKLLEESLDSRDETSPQPTVKSYRKISDESGAMKQKSHHQKTPSPSRHSSPSPVHSEIRSLEELFPIRSTPEHTHSEISVQSDDFNVNIMTLDDLSPVCIDTAAVTIEQTTSSPSLAREISETDLEDPGDESHQDDPALYPSDFESENSTAQSADEISERLADAHDAGPQSSSSSRTSQKDEDDTASEGPVRCNGRGRGESRSRRSRFSETPSYCSDFSISHIETRSPESRRSRKDVMVQTQADGLKSTWSSGPAALGPSLGMSYVDPTPVPSHMISAEVIEALSAYSPATLALNDVLKQQLALTRSFTQSSRFLHQTMLESLGPANYRYTTLEDTKTFIRCNRPPKLTLEDALEEVLQEMRDYHYI